MKTIISFFLILFCLNCSTELFAQCTVDAAVRFDDAKAYFFQGNSYVRFNLKSKKVDPGYPKPIQGNWGGVWADGVDAAFNYDDNTVYLFKKGYCIRYDKRTNKALAGYPKLIRKDFTGIWPSGIDAALDAGDQVYCFKGNKVVILDKKTRMLKMIDKQSVQSINEVFKGSAFQTLGAALDRNHMYLFSGDSYVRFKKNPAEFNQDAGYPKMTYKYWPGVSCEPSTSILSGNTSEARIRVKISYLKCESVDDAATAAELALNKTGLYNSDEEIYGFYAVIAENYKTKKRLEGNRDNRLWARSHDDHISLEKGEGHRIDQEIYFNIPLDQLVDANISLMAWLFERDGENHAFSYVSGVMDDLLNEKVVLAARDIPTTSKKYVIDHRDGDTHLKTVFYVQRMN